MLSIYKWLQADEAEALAVAEAEERYLHSQDAADEVEARAEAEAEERWAASLVIADVAERARNGS